MKKHLNIPIFIPHLGCPNGCVFCNQKKISGHVGFCREAVKRELDTAFATVTGEIPAQIAYFGGSFTGIDREDMLFLLGVAKEYIDAGKCESIRISTRPDYISEEILGILWDHGVRTIELGIQSMDDEVLRSSRRGHTAEDSVRAMTLVKSFGFELVGQMMTGLPASTVASEIMTAKRICEMGADGARIYPTVVFRETVLAEMAKRGEYLPLTTEDAVERTAAALSIFLAHGVNVIRVGLQATELLTGGEETMSAYHPAIGEMVYSRYFRDALEKALKHEKTNGKYAEISVNPADLSKMIGQKGANRQYLQMQFSLRGIRFCPDEKMAKNGFSVMLTE